MENITPPAANAVVIEAQPEQTVYISAALNEFTPIADKPITLSESRKEAIIHQLVLPFGSEGKIEPAIHIHATAAGYRSVYQAIADAMQPDGEITQLLAQAIRQEMPEMTDVAAYQSAKSYSINRRNQALGIVEALAAEGEIVQTAIEYSSRLINQEISPDLIPQGKHQELSIIEDKASRLQQFAEQPLDVPRAIPSTHALAFAAGHIPMHQALEKMFSADSPLVEVLTKHITAKNPAISGEMAKQASIGYLDFGRNMAHYDVEHLPAVVSTVIQQSTQSNASQSAAPTSPSGKLSEAISYLGEVKPAMVASLGKS